MASCFFCGKSGPETIIQVFFSKPTNFETDEVVTITGQLKLNNEDKEVLNYILVDAQGK